MPIRETYLGDGCYASFDGYQICLRAPREKGDHLIFLEPEVYRALVAFHTSIHTKPTESSNEL